MSHSSASRSGLPGLLKAFVSFPSPYTQTLLVQALVSVLAGVSISLIPPPEDDPPALQWADYDLLAFDHPRSHPTTHLTSSYIYRKALIRKHNLHLAISEYLAKCRHRGVRSILAPRDEGGEGGWPRGWVLELQFADELEEAMRDELWDLAEDMRGNEGREEYVRKWFILKPGFADRAQGIRLFSTEEELQRIFESFEPPDSEDEDGEEEEEEDEVETSDPQAGLAEEVAKLQFGTERDDDGENADGSDRVTGVMTSQLRYFVIQEYISRPILFKFARRPGDPSSALTGYKFHLRAYVLLTGSYTVHLSRTMLALFSSSPYIHPTLPNPSSPNLDLDDELQDQTELDLRPHLTNTCLQTDAYGAPTPPEELVKLFWELEGMDALALRNDGRYEKRGVVNSSWLDTTFARTGQVIAEAIKAGVECGSFGLQLVPNAFEIFGVDLLLSFPPSGDTPTNPAHLVVPPPTITLLEFNASPDFRQSGERLKPNLLEMFRGVVRIAIAPFFGLETVSEKGRRESVGEEPAPDAVSQTAEKDGLRSRRPPSRSRMETGALVGSDTEVAWKIGDERWGWRLVGRGEISGAF